MNQQRTLIRISELISRYKIQIGLLNSADLGDIRTISESILIPILNELYNCNLINANSIKKNFPAVDLLDSNEKIAFQITVTSTQSKVNHTLRGIIKNWDEYFKTYKRFYVIILSSKKSNYKNDELNKIINGKFKFDNTHIFDLKDIFSQISYLEFSKLKNILNLLEENFSDKVISEIINKTIKKETQIDELKIGNPNFFDELKSFEKIRSKWIMKKHFYMDKEVSISDSEKLFENQLKLKGCGEKIIEVEGLINDLINK